MKKMTKISCLMGLLMFSGLIAAGCNPLGADATLSMVADEGVTSSLKIQTYWAAIGCAVPPYDFACTKVKEMSVGSKDSYAFLEGTSKHVIKVRCQNTGLFGGARSIDSGPGYSHTIHVKKDKLTLDTLAPGASTPTTTDLSGCVNR